MPSSAVGGSSSPSERSSECPGSSPLTPAAPHQRSAATGSRRCAAQARSRAPRWQRAFPTRSGASSTRSPSRAPSLRSGAALRAPLPAKPVEDQFDRSLLCAIEVLLAGGQQAEYPPRQDLLDDAVEGHRGKAHIGLRAHFASADRLGEDLADQRVGLADLIEVTS